MEELIKILLEIAHKLEEMVAQGNSSNIKNRLKKLEEVANDFGKSWSGSWFGYHAYIYYKDFKTPPSGAHFSIEWGLERNMYVPGTVGDWVDYEFETVYGAMLKKACEPETELIEKLANSVEATFKECKSEILSTLITILEKKMMNI